MYKLFIENGSSFLYLDNGLDGINDCDMIAFLINRDNIKSLIEILPIRKYYLNTWGKIVELSKEDAMDLFDKFEEHNQEIIAKKQNKKK